MLHDGEWSTLFEAFDKLAEAGEHGMSKLHHALLQRLSVSHARTIASEGDAPHPGAGVARTSKGVFVTSKALVEEVLLNAEGNYTIEGYLPRMRRSIGEIYLGLDDGPEYRRLSKASNAAISAVTRREAFDRARKETLEAVAALKYPDDFDMLAVADVVLAKLCAYWFDIPDGTFVVAGGFGLSDFSPPGKCPADYTPPSGFIVHPDPDLLMTMAGQCTGQILRESVKNFVAAQRASDKPPRGSITRALFEEFPNSPQDDDTLARTIVGVMMGALPTINGNLTSVVNLWRASGQFAELKAKVKASAIADPFERATAVVEAAMMRTMQTSPTPDALWRTAAKDHTLGPAQVAAGDKIYLSIVSATHEDRAADVTDVRLLFGGDRSKSPHPTHACPGYEMGMGVLLGVISGVLESVVS